MNAKPGKKDRRYAYVGMIRTKKEWIPIGFGMDFGEASDATEDRIPDERKDPRKIVIRPCTQALYASRDTIDFFRIGEDILIPSGGIPVRNNQGIADLGFYRRALVCGSRVIAVARSPAALLATLEAIYSQIRDDTDVESVFRCGMMRNARVVPCSEKLYREAVAAGHGPDDAVFKMDTLGEYRSGLLVSPDEHYSGPWAYAVEYGTPGIFEVCEVGKSYNDLFRRSMISVKSPIAWDPPIPKDISGVYAVLQCTRALYSRVLASPWYRDRIRSRIRCIIGTDGRFEII